METKLAMKDLTSGDLWDIKNARIVPMQITDHDMNSRIELDGDESIPYCVPIGCNTIAKQALRNSQIELGDVVYQLDDNGDSDLDKTELLFWPAEIVEVPFNTQLN